MIVANGLSRMQGGTIFHVVIGLHHNFFLLFKKRKGRGFPEGDLVGLADVGSVEPVAFLSESHLDKGLCHVFGVKQYKYYELTINSELVLKTRKYANLIFIRFWIGIVD